METELTNTDAAGAVGERAALAGELEKYRREVEAVKRDALDLAEGLTDAQFNWRPAPARWSIGECLAHLNATGQVFLILIDREIKRGRERQLVGRGPFRHGLIGSWFVRSLEPPARLKVKAPKQVAPLPENLTSVVVPAFMSLQEQLLKRIGEADGIDLGRVRFPSPFFKLLRMSLGQAIAATIAHERRHLWQAREVKKDPNFPGGR